MALKQKSYQLVRYKILFRKFNDDDDDDNYYLL